MNSLNSDSQPNDEIARRVTIHLLVGSTVLAAGSYLLLYHLSRKLSVDEYSQFAAFWSILTGVVIGITSPLETFSLSVTRTTSGGTKIDIALLSAIKKVFTLGSIGLFIFFPWLAPRVFDDSWNYFLAVYVSFLGFIIIYSSRGILVAEARTKAYATIMSVETLLRLALAIFLTWAFSPLGHVASSSLALAAVISGSLSLKSVKKQVLANFIGGIKLARTNIRCAEPRNTQFLPILVASLSALIMLNFGPFALQYLSGPEISSAGFFLNALLIARIPIFIGPILQARIIPKTVNFLGQNQFFILKSFIKYNVFKLIITGLVFTTLFVLMGNAVIRIFFVSTFQFENFDLVLIAAPTVLYLSAIVFQSILVAGKRSSSILKAWSGGLAIYLIVFFADLEPLQKVEIASVLGLLSVNIFLSVGIRKALRSGWKIIETC